MKEYAFLKEPVTRDIHAGTIHNMLKGGLPNLVAVSLVTHTDPWVVMVRTSVPMSREEREFVESQIARA